MRHAASPGHDDEHPTLQRTLRLTHGRPLAILALNRVVYHLDGAVFQAVLSA